MHFARQQFTYKKGADFPLDEAPSFCLAVTPAASFLVDENLPEDRMTFAGAIVVEHR